MVAPSRMTILGGMMVLTAIGVHAALDEPPGATPSLPPLPHVAPKEPKDALTTFRVREGFRLDLLAAEPLVTDPVAMDYDENGLAYVVEMRDYPYTDKTSDKPFQERTTDQPLGRVRILEDTDGDGVFDAATIFAEDLSWPTGLAFWQGGVFVTATPDVWYLKDTDGDRKADVRRKVFTGFRKFNVQAVINNLRWGMDHRLYAAGSTNGGKIQNLANPASPPISLTAQDFRFDPRSESFEPLPGGARFGNTFNDLGDRFICNIRNPIQQVVLPGDLLAKAPGLPVRSAVHDVAEAGDTLPIFRASPPEPWRVMNAQRLARETTKVSPRSESTAAGYVTSACGLTIYRGSAYPPTFYGNAFLGEVAGNLIHRQVPSPRGVAFTSRRAPGEETTEFAASTDNWFRPVNFVNAPDGTLHLMDMYRETIEHPWSIPDDIKARLDLESGRDRGRIYRLTPPGFRPREHPRPRLGQATVVELVQTLAHPDGWWRDTAHRLLFERQDRAAVPLLRERLRAQALEPDTPRDRPVDLPAIARVLALWSLHGLKALTSEDLLLSLEDPAVEVREQAVRLAGLVLASTDSTSLRSAVRQRAGDDSPRVRFQVALALVNWGRDPARIDALARIARRDSTDPWVLTAVLAAVGTDAPALLSALLDSPQPLEITATAPLWQDLGTMIAAMRQQPLIEDTLRRLEAIDRKSQDLRPIVTVVLLGLVENLAARQTSAAVPPISDSGRRLLDRLVSAASSAVNDQNQPVEQRTRAIRVISAGDPPRAREMLINLIDPQQPSEVQIAAARGFASTRAADVAPVLLSRFKPASAALRGEIIEILTSRAEWILALLSAVERNEVGVNDIPLARRGLLLRHPTEPIKAKALAVFGRERGGSRQEVVARYEPALGLPANRDQGARVYQRECRPCHKLGDDGNEIGPNLVTIRHRAANEVLLHILDPNREVGPNFQDYTIALKDGRVTNGVILEETPSAITIARPVGGRETIPRSSIEQIMGSGRSLMPEGLEQAISIQNMADLLSFLLNP